jgi:hypothetical protein
MDSLKNMSAPNINIAKMSRKDISVHKSVPNV